MDYVQQVNVHALHIASSEGWLRGFAVAGFTLSPAGVPSVLSAISALSWFFSWL